MDQILPSFQKFMAHGSSSWLDQVNHRLRLRPRGPTHQPEPMDWTDDRSIALARVGKSFPPGKGDGASKTGWKPEGKKWRTQPDASAQSAQVDSGC